MQTSLSFHTLKTIFLRHTVPLWAIAALIALGACTKKQEHPDVPRLRTQLGAAQKRMGELELEIKTAKDDPVTAASLGEEKELLRSRIGRTKEQLIRLGDTSVAEPATGGGGHH